MPLSKKAAEETDSDDQQPDILDTPEQKRFNDLLSQIKEEQKNINMSLFEEVFGYDTSDKMLQTLHSLKRVDSYNQEAFSIEKMVVRFGNRVLEKDARRPWEKQSIENTEDCKQDSWF